MDLFVLVIVAVLGIVCAASAVAGFTSMMSASAEPVFENLMVGICTSTFSAAILLCCLYTRLPFGNGEGYMVPIAFGLTGIGFLSAAAVRCASERRHSGNIAQ